MRQPFQPVVLRFDSLASTNTEVARQAQAGAPEGLCVVAREQTAGRGRRERAWVSPKDAGLYLSILVRPQFDAAQWPLLTLAAALAACDALAEACDLRADIKWPNDLLARGRKLCGILAEAVETRRGRACIVGIGINLDDRAFPAEIARHATSVEAETGAPPNCERLLEALMRSFACRYARLYEPEGARATVAAWSEASSFAAGRRVRVVLEAGSFEGTTRGLEEDGALRVEMGDGEMRIVRAGDVTALRDAQEQN